MSKPSANSFASLADLGAELEDVSASLDPSANGGARQSKQDAEAPGGKGAARGSSGKVVSSSADDEEDWESTTTVKKKELKNPLVWIDLEMTGLDIEHHAVIEVACLITDGDLETVVEGPEIAIHHDEEVLDKMNDWSREHHAASGLTQRVRESTIGLQQAEQQLLEFLQAHIPANTAQLAGNSVHVDRMFLVKHMPAFIDYLSFKIVDVTSVKELARRWCPDAFRKAPRKTLAHTAMSDVKESVEELRHYRQTIFMQSLQSQSSSYLTGPARSGRGSTRRR